jgi:hypothetical protein
MMICVFRGKQENPKGKGKETVEKTLQTPLEIYKSNCYSNILIKEFAWKI